MSNSQAPVASWPYQLFRALISIHALLCLTATVFAAGYIGGEFESLTRHRGSALAVAGLTLLVAVAVTLYKMRGGGPVWLLVVAWVLVPAAVAQVGLGFEGKVAVHVTLGVLIVSTSLMMTVWAWAAPALTRSAPSRPAGATT